MNNMRKCYKMKFLKNKKKQKKPQQPENIQSNWFFSKTNLFCNHYNIELDTWRDRPLGKNQ